MTDGVKKIGDARMADAVVKAYAAHTTPQYTKPPLSSSKCDSLGINGERCEALNHAIEYEDHASTNIELISEVERGELGHAGFTDEFIDRLAGADGRRLLYERVKWLGRNCVNKRFDLSAREYMLIELQWKHEFAAAVIPNLIKLLDDKQMAERAMSALGGIGPMAAPALPKLIKLGEKIGFNDYVLASVLSGIDPDGNIVLPHVFEWLQRQPYSDEFVGWLPQRLSMYGIATLPYLIQMIEREDKYILEAIEAMGLIGHEAKSAVPFLCQKLGSPEMPVEYKKRIVAALGEIGDVEAIPAILSTLDNAEMDNPTIALSGMGLPALEAILKAYRERSGAKGNLNILFTYVASAIGRAAIPTLIALMEGEDRRLKFSALLAVSNIGDKALETIPYLIAIIERETGQKGHKYETDKEVAGEALAKMGQDAVDQISKALERNSGEVKLCLIGVLGKMKDSEPAAVKLAELLNDDDPSVRESALTGINLVGVGNKRVVDAVIYRLMDPDKEVVEGALYSLWLLSFVANGVSAHNAIPLLERIIGDESFNQRSHDLATRLREKIENSIL